MPAVDHVRCGCASPRYESLRGADQRGRGSHGDTPSARGLTKLHGLLEHIKIKLLFAIIHCSRSIRIIGFIREAFG
jgi:hypothetical protein